jgi:RNA polymerase sigma-70 factor (ECF subfamily)
MKRINLKDIYPFYETDRFIVVDDAVAEAFDEFRRSDQACKRRIYRNRSHYSLDCSDGIECAAIATSESPDNIYDKKLKNRRLYAAISRLPEKQAKRIYACFFLDMSMSDIARAEGVSVKAVSNSISRGLVSLKKELINFWK